jgi:hypothetical protein
LNCAACGACSKDWRALSSALTLTPLSAFAGGEMVVVEVMVMVSVSCAVTWLTEPGVRFLSVKTHHGIGLHRSLSDGTQLAFLEVMIDVVLPSCI